MMVTFLKVLASSEGEGVAYYEQQMRYFTKVVCNFLFADHSEHHYDVPHLHLQPTGSSNNATATLPLNPLTPLVIAPISAPSNTTTIALSMASPSEVDSSIRKNGEKGNSMATSVDRFPRSLSSDSVSSSFSSCKSSIFNGM